MALDLKNKPVWPVLALLCLASQALAAGVAGVEVRREGALILIRMHIRVDAPPAAVFRALQDYTALPHYAPSVRTVHVEPTAEPNRVRLYTTIHACVLFFCKTMHQEQIMTATADAHGGVLRSRLVPQGSDFKKGHASWTVKPCPAREAPTCVDIRLQMVPAFWVPPLIGPWLIGRKMRAQAHLASVGLQRIALRDARLGNKLQTAQDTYSKPLIKKALQNRVPASRSQ